MHFSWQALILQLGMWFIFTNYISQENKISQLRPKVIRILWLNFCGFVLSSLSLNKFCNARMALSSAELSWAVFNHKKWFTTHARRTVLVQFSIDIFQNSMKVFPIETLVCEHIPNELDMWLDIIWNSLNVYLREFGLISSIEFM